MLTSEPVRNGGSAHSTNDKRAARPRLCGVGAPVEQVAIENAAPAGSLVRYPALFQHG